MTRPPSQSDAAPLTPPSSAPTQLCGQPRRLPLLRLGLGGSLLAALALAGCTPGETTGNMDMTPPPDPQVRLAHFLVDIPGFDLCVKAPGDSDYTGPLIKTMLSRNGGVSYGYATGYMPLKPVAYVAHVVSGLATSCNVTSLGGVPDQNLATLVAGKRYTIAAMGAPPFSAFKLPVVAVIEDDLTVVANQTRLRFVHAADGQGGLEFGSGSSGTYARNFSASDYTKVGDAGGQTYLTVPPVANGTYSLRMLGAGGDLVPLLNKVTLAAGAVYTATAIGVAGSGSSPLAISLCNDSAPPTSGLAACNELR